jgi:hypothetical protein
MTTLQTLRQNARTRFDLTEPAHQSGLYTLAEALLARPEIDAASLRATAGGDAPLEFRLAAKLVASRRFVQTIARPVKLGLVFAMWGEGNRLRPRSADNPHGEDALRTKLEQLAWLFDGTPVDWHLYPVDDGSPDGDGALAAEIAAEHPLGERVSVLDLREALPHSGALAPLRSADDSRKGGAVILGCLRALEDGVEAVLYTDADSSVHLGQSGLLLRPWLESGARVVLGNRKHPDAVLVKQEGRWGIGIKVLRHMQRMVGRAIFEHTKDTQAAFKLYDAEVLRRIVGAPSVFDFSFDTDWLFAALAGGETLTTVPFAFIDSFAESASITQGPMTTWETLLKGLVTSARARGVAHDEAMARVLDEEIHSHRDLELLIHHLPPELEAAAPEDLGNPAILSPEALQRWIQARKREAAGS